MKKRRNRKRIRRRKCMLYAIAAIVVILYFYIVITLIGIIVKNIQGYYENTKKTEYVTEEGSQDLEDNSENKLNGLKDCPEELLHALEINPEMEDFVLNYPLKRGTCSRDTLDDYLGNIEVPLLLQWDSRWGYYTYGSSIMGVTGCGPTCLSMVALHLLQDTKLTPIFMADYAIENGYYIEGVGTDWSFMIDGAKALGLKVQEVSLTERIVKRHLEQGRPIICAMRRGDFTEKGHFIVLIDVEEGKIRVNDPNSRENSEKLWDYETLEYQIKNMWAYSL